MLIHRRKDSSPKIELPPPVKTLNTGASVSGSTPGAKGDKLGFDEPNALAEVIANATSGTNGPGLPGLVNSKVNVSPKTSEALLTMAKEDPALYGRIIQHLNALDPKKEWNVKLSAFEYDAIDPKLNAKLTTRLETSLSEAGLGKGGDKTGAFWGAVKYESVEKTEVTKEAQLGNAAEVEALQKELADWNTQYASVFKFDQGVGSEVNNPTESKEALEKLIGILESHQDAVDQASFDFTGFTSTEGSDASNQALSEQRAFTIHGMFSAMVDESSLNGRITLSNRGGGEFAPVDANGKPLALDGSNRPVEPSLEDREKSRRVEVRLTADPKIIEPKDAETKTWREGLEVRLEISAKPKPTGGGGHNGWGESHVTKSPISKSIGGKIPCPDWLNKLRN